MIDREKVIKGLEICESADKTCFNCPYSGENCTTKLSADTLASLKQNDSDMQRMESIIEEYEKEKYYFITVFEKIEADKLGWPNTGSSRCWGFYRQKDVALQALHENWTDMEETIYQYAVLEEYNEGISHATGYSQWFKFDDEKGGYFEIEEPECAKHFIGWSIG